MNRTTNQKRAFPIKQQGFGGVYENQAQKTVENPIILKKCLMDVV
jgi:hypothetical protein